MRTVHYLSMLLIPALMVLGCTPTSPDTTLNFGPRANAGGDLTAKVGEPVTLDGSATTGASTFTWTQVSGPTATLIQPDTAQAAFTPAEAGIYVFRLDVENASGGTDSSTIKVTVSENLVDDGTSNDQDPEDPDGDTADPDGDTTNPDDGDVTDDDPDDNQGDDGTDDQDDPDQDGSDDNTGDDTDNDTGDQSGDTGNGGDTGSGDTPTPEPEPVTLRTLTTITFSADVPVSVDPASYSIGGGTVIFSGGVATEASALPSPLTFGYVDNFAFFPYTSGVTASITFSGLDVRQVSLYFPDAGAPGATLSAVDANGDAILTIQSRTAGASGDSAAMFILNAEDRSIAELLIEVPSGVAVTVDELQLTIAE